MRHLSNTDSNFTTVTNFVEINMEEKGWLITAPNNDMWSFTDLKELHEFTSKRLDAENGGHVAVVIYHGNCLDGFASMYAARQYFGETALYVEGHYGEPPPDVKGKDVFMVDFSYSCEVVAKMLTSARTVTLVDHHETSLRNLRELEKDGLAFANSSISNSGCVLAWRYFANTKEMPWFFKYIQDRDLWAFSYSNTDMITAYLYSQDFSYERWQEIEKVPEKDILVLGKLLVDARDKRIASAIDRCTRKVFMFGRMVPLVNAAPDLASNIGNILSADSPFAAVYEDRTDGRVVSLRSSASNPFAMNVAELAEMMGGGGHKHAASFKVDFDSDIGRL